MKATAAAGWDTAKWQLFAPERLASQDAAAYWDPALGGSPSQLETFRANGMLTHDEWRRVVNACAEHGIRFLCTPFDLEAVDELEDLGIGEYKIASGDITYKSLIEKVARTGKPVVLSTGAALLGEIDRALWWLSGSSVSSVTLLACDLAYPTALEDARLDRIMQLYGHFRGRTAARAFGYSDHTVESFTSMLAAGWGATVLEKHCTIDRAGPAPDDRMALAPDAMADYARYAQFTIALDWSAAQLWQVSSVERPARVGARRSLYAARDLAAGAVLTDGDIACLRPCPEGAFTPADLAEIVGRRLVDDLSAGSHITREAMAVCLG